MGGYHVLRADRDTPVGVDDPDRMLHIRDISPETYERTQKYYAERVEKCVGPTTAGDINLNIYHNLLFVGREESAFDFWILVHLGGVIETHQSNSILIKHPTNVLPSHGFIALDGIVETGIWHGFESAAIKPLRKNVWVDVLKSRPICQAVGYSNPILSLENVQSRNVDDHFFMHSLNWYTRDPDYRQRPGKYQRELKLKPNKIDLP
ncbi:MAG: hypothetical protein AAF449_06785 [Myxococcota bacterium]